MAVGSKGCCNIAHKILSASSMGQTTGFGIPRPTHLPANFNLQNIAGKRVCKTALQEELGLKVDSEAALVVLVSRITEQKMADVVAAAFPGIIESGSQFAVLGDGDRLLEERFKAAARHARVGSRFASATRSRLRTGSLPAATSCFIPRASSHAGSRSFMRCAMVLCLSLDAPVGCAIWW